MSEVPLFGDPLERSSFLRDSAPLPQGGDRTKGPIQIGLGIILATGLTATHLAYTEVSASSRGYAEISISVGTENLVPRTTKMADRQPPLSDAWRNYLKSLNNILPGPYARSVRKLWSDLSRGVEQPIPHAGPTQQGSFILSWDAENHHFEIEVFGDNHFEWFYCDRASDVYEGAEGNRRQAVEAAQRYLKYLSAV